MSYIKQQSNQKIKQKAIWTPWAGLSQKDGTSISVILKATKKTVHKQRNISIKL